MQHFKIEKDPKHIKPYINKNSNCVYMEKQDSSISSEKGDKLPIFY